MLVFFKFFHNILHKICSSNKMIAAMLYIKYVAEQLKSGNSPI